MYHRLLKKIILSDFLCSRLFFRVGFLKELAVTIGTHALMRSQYWDTEEMKDIQLKKIQNIVSHANQKVRFWQDRLKPLGIANKKNITWNDFHKILITKKTDFKPFEKEYFTDTEELSRFKAGENAYTKEITRGKTSGSTSEPLGFFQDYHYEMRSLAVCRRMILTVGRGSLLPLIAVRPRYRRGFAEKKITWFFMYNYNHLKHKIGNLHRFSQGLNSPFILYGFASYLIEIAKLCAERHIPLRPRGVITTGESLEKEQKEYVEKSLKTEVFNCYAAQELGRLSFDCEHHNLHINSEYAYIEIVDKDGNRLENGKEGRVIVTTFDNKVMPFIRYDNGDLGVLSEDQCECGRKLPRIKITGRFSHIIRLSEGREVPFLDAIVIFHGRDDLIRQYQLIQAGRDDFIVKIVFEEDTENQERDAVFIDIAKKMRMGLHHDIKINFETVTEIEPTHTGKKIVFKSLIKE